jgi:hypothetical protein
VIANHRDRPRGSGAEAPLRELIASLRISTRKLTAEGDLYPAAAETRWHNFAAANYSQLAFHLQRSAELRTLQPDLEFD